ncbi:MAG TPA: GAF domain-containing sensor histidine kinase [Aggregatilineales bacterium]|nr:GAF domain-containing sensor histidine kinase [Aggregatilineales bacterium]
MVDVISTYKAGVGSEESRPTQPSRARLHYAALLETSLALTRVQDYHEFLQLILEKMLEVSGADSATVLLFDENTFYIIGGRDPRGSVYDEAVPLSSAVIDRVKASLDTVCVREIAHDPELRNDTMLASKYISAVVALPMFRNATLFGLVYLDSHAALDGIDDLDLSILKGMTADLALYTDNVINLSEIARLGEETEAELKERTQSFVEANEFLATNLERMEREAAAQDLDNRERARFYAALAHEFRSPMQLILGHAHMVLAQGEERLSPDQRRSLDVILKTSQHIRDLVTKVMDANKLDENAMTLVTASFDLRPLIDEVIAMGQGFLADKPDVHLTTFYNQDAFPLVLGDVTRIRQVLLNLVSNACRFTDTGKITVSAMEHETYVVVSVCDTGTGIPQDKISTIFEPYMQADSLRSHTGAGLGLTISKQLVELHGGKMIVKSTVGVGSIFAFNLPIAL